jgi:hypothetical protein
MRTKTIVPPALRGGEYPSRRMSSAMRARAPPSTSSVSTATARGRTVGTCGGDASFSIIGHGLRRALIRTSVILLRGDCSL